MSFKRRGMALMIVLLASVVLAMLSTAMVSLNRNGLLSLGQYEQRSRSMQACYAGLDYARARFLQNAAWGISKFDDAPTSLDLPETKVLEIGADPAANRVEGSLPLEESTFQVRVVNNLANRFALPAPAWSRCKISIPARTAFVSVDGLCRGSRRHIEVLLVRKVGVGVGIYAGKDLAISLASEHNQKVLAFSSNLPRGNHVNVNNNVLLPHTSNIDFGSTSVRGRLQSGADTKIDSSFNFLPNGDAGPSSGRSLLGDPDLTSQSSLEMKANVHTGAPPSPPKFQPDQLKQAGAAANLKAGTYRFINHETVQFTPAPGVPGGPQLYQGSVPTDGGADIQLGEFRFMPQGNVHVDGDMRILGEQTKLEMENGRMVPADTTPMPVSLAVGYGNKGLPLSYDLAGTQTATKSRLTVSGNLTVRGDMVGSGQLFVQKNALGGGSLTVEGNSQLSATRTDGMALVAEDSVHFKDVNTMAAVQPFAMLTNEFDLYAQALQSGSYSATQQDTINNWQGQGTVNITSVVGNDDSPGPTLRGQVIGGYDDVLREMAPGFMTPGGTSLATVDVVVPRGAPGAPVDTTLTAQQLVEDYLQEVNTNQGGMTLGRHTRVREFIKSVDRGAPNPALLSVWHPSVSVPGLSSTLGDASYAAYGESIFTLVANQVSAYNQDARLRGLQLMAFMGGSNPYTDGQRFDFIFGGILYAKNNVYAHLANRFNLLGSMMSAEGTVGFDHLVGGKVVYDPNSFEDQFDVTKIGLSANFFWMAP